MTAASWKEAPPRGAAGSHDHEDLGQDAGRDQPRLSMGPVGEFLMVGGATPVLLALSWLLRSQLNLDTLELAVGFSMFHAAHVLNDPHFSVSYLLFYEDARGRALGEFFGRPLRLRYLFAGFVVPALLTAWCAWALIGHSAQAMGWLLQLMFLLVGWHYVKQGFGVTVVLSARRGVRFSITERRALLAHCLSAWAYAWANPSTPSRQVEVKGVVYTAFARPAWFEGAALAVLVATSAWLLLSLIRKRRREGALPLWTPLTALVCSVWAWSIFAHIDPLVRYMVPALHALQYLYFVGLLKGNEAREREGPPWFETSAGSRLLRLAATALALGWVFFDGAPEALDGWLATGDGDLGPTPYFAAIYAFVNIHHYFMDNVLWRRDRPATRYLFWDTAGVSSGKAPGAVEREGGAVERDDMGAAAL